MRGKRVHGGYIQWGHHVQTLLWLLHRHRFLHNILFLNFPGRALPEGRSQPASISPELHLLLRREETLQQDRSPGASAWVGAPELGAPLPTGQGLCCGAKRTPRLPLRLGSSASRSRRRGSQAPRMRPPVGGMSGQDPHSCSVGDCDAAAGGLGTQPCWAGASQRSALGWGGGLEWMCEGHFGLCHKAPHSSGGWPVWLQSWVQRRER